MDDNTTNQNQNNNILLEEEALLGGSPATSAAGGATTAGTQIGASQQAASKFHIPALVKQKYPKLIPLILETESMDDEEREYWFQILPIMTNEQVDQFKHILVTEKEQLAKLDAEYEAELAKINEKHINQWQAFETKQQREALEKSEKAYEVGEEAAEADLLAKLQNL